MADGGFNGSMVHKICDRIRDLCRRLGGHDDEHTTQRCPEIGVEMEMAKQSPRNRALAKSRLDAYWQIPSSGSRSIAVTTIRPLSSTSLRESTSADTNERKWPPHEGLSVMAMSRRSVCGRILVMAPCWGRRDPRQLSVQDSVCAE
jgi:hypothetical protein